MHATSPARGLLVPLLIALALLSGCASFPRRMRYASRESAAMHGARMDHAVYVPPGFAADERLPLVVFLHGGGDSHDAFDRHGISARLDRAMREGRAPRAVIVLPDGQLGFWANWYDGTRRYEDWIADELVPAVRERYHTRACPDDCHVMGVSMGGAGALSIAHHRPDRFSTVTAISAPVFDTDGMIDFVRSRLFAIIIPTHRIFGPPTPRSRIERDDLYLQWTTRESTGMRRIVLAWGDHDRGGIKQGSRAFSRHLTEHDIPHDAWEYDGGHAWVAWGPVIERALVTQLGE